MKTSSIPHRKLRKILERAFRAFFRIPGFSKNPPELGKISTSDIGKIYLFYGEKEYNTWKSVIWGLNKKITERRKSILDESEEIVVPESGHFMKSKKYIKQINNKVSEEV